MSLRGLLVLLLVLAAAVAAVLWLPGKREGEADPASTAEPPLVALRADEIAAVEVARAGVDFRLERRPGIGWVLTRPALQEARGEAAEALLRAVLDARAKRVLEARLPEADRATFGLADPEAVVKLFPTGAVPSPVSLRLGGTSPVSPDRYVEDDRGRLLLTDAALAGSLDTSPEDLAERRLLPVLATDITGIRVLRPDGEVRLAREGSGWKLLAPVADRADASDADAWARLLSGLERSRPLRDTETARAAAALARPQVRVSVTLAGGSALPEIAIAGVGPMGGKDDAERYAGRPSRVPGAAPVQGPVPASSLDDLLRDAASLRDPLLASFDVPAVREVRILEGARALALVRAEGQDASWSAQEDGKPAAAPEPSAVAAWLDRVRLVRASDFAPPGAAFTPLRSVTVVLSDGRKLSLEVGGASGERALVRGSERPAVVAWVSTESLPPWPLRVADLKAPADP